MIHGPAGFASPQVKIHKARRTPSISAARIYVYKYVYIYFSADGQAWAVESLESGNLMVYGLLKIVSQFVSGHAPKAPPTREIQTKDSPYCLPAKNRQFGR